MAAEAEGGSLASIRAAAVRLFFEQGYDATALRQIAAEAGLKVGSLYYHIAGKEALLTEIMCAVLDDLLIEARAAVAAEATPTGRLRAAVAAHIRFHAARSPEVFVGNTELRSLSAQGREAVVGRRKAYEEFLAGVIEDAAASEAADPLDLRVHLYSLLAQAAHVAGWYRSEGRSGVEDLGHTYSQLALRGLGLVQVS
jgi:AcrR family transcriptional regulator